MIMLIGLGLVGLVGMEIIFVAKLMKLKKERSKINELSKIIDFELSVIDYQIENA